MNWRFWRSPRDVAISDIRKRIHYMSKTIDGEYEDAELMELLDEMDILGRKFDRLLQPENPAAPQSASAIPQEAIDAALDLVPEGWRGIAGVAVRRLLNDPTRLKQLQEKLLPYLQKQGLAPAQQGLVGSNPTQTPPLPLELSGRPYDPNRPNQ